MGNLINAFVEVEGSKSTVFLRVGSKVFLSVSSEQHAFPIFVGNLILLKFKF